MKLLYGTVIFVSLSFNGFVQSYAYDAWRTGIPLERIIQARGNVDDAVLLLTLKELGEIRTT